MIEASLKSHQSIYFQGGVLSFYLLLMNGCFRHLMSLLDTLGVIIRKVCCGLNLRVYLLSVCFYRQCGNIS
jgi:hypothetical protein